MLVRIRFPEGWGSFEEISGWKVGLKPMYNMYFTYQVEDEKLFFLSVIKYGIVFEEVSTKK